MWLDPEDVSGTDLAPRIEIRNIGEFQFEAGLEYIVRFRYR